MVPEVLRRNILAPRHFLDPRKIPVPCKASRRLETLRQLGTYCGYVRRCEDVVIGSSTFSVPHGFCAAHTSTIDGFKDDITVDFLFWNTLKYVC